MCCCFVKQKTADEMRIRDGSSDVCSGRRGATAVRDGPESNADPRAGFRRQAVLPADRPHPDAEKHIARPQAPGREEDRAGTEDAVRLAMRGADPPRAGRLSRTGAKSGARVGAPPRPRVRDPRLRSEEHTSELQSLMRISYAVFCLKKKN